MARNCFFITWRMFKKSIVNAAATIVVIFIVVIIIFYNYSSEIAGKHEIQIQIGWNYHTDSDTDTASLPSFENITKIGLKFDAKVGCSQLHDIAKQMLAGAKVALPFEVNKFGSKKKLSFDFHDSLSHAELDELSKTSFCWNYPWARKKNKMLAKKYFKQFSKVKSKDMKVRKYFITFAEGCCQTAMLTALKCARSPGGFDFTIAHDLSSVSKGFQRTHSAILRQKRGSGYWLWKPYIVLQSLVGNMADGDVLMYQDAGAYFIRDAGPLLKLAQHTKYGIVIFHTEFPEKHFSKRDAFVLMDMDDVHVYETLQRLGAFLVIRKSCETLQFVMEWLAYASDARILTDMANEMGRENIVGFSDNRHDQTVLSLLSKKWSIEAYRDPSQYGNELGNLTFLAGPYRQLIHHSRDRT